MLIDVKSKGTISLPKDVVRKLKLATGDKIDLVVTEDGVITLTPVVVLTKKEYTELEAVKAKYEPEVVSEEVTETVEEAK